MTVATPSAPGNPGSPAPAAPAIEVSSDLAAIVRPGPKSAAAGFARYLEWLKAENPGYAADRAAMNGADLAADTRFRWRQYAFRRSDIYDHAHELRGDLLYLIQQIEAFAEPYDGTEFAAALHAAGVPDVTPGDEADARTMFGYMHRAAVAGAKRLRAAVDRFDEVSLPPYEEPAATPRPPVLAPDEAADTAAVYAALLDTADHVEAFAAWFDGSGAGGPGRPLALTIADGDLDGLPWALRTAAEAVWRQAARLTVARADELSDWEWEARRGRMTAGRFDPAAAEVDPRAAAADLLAVCTRCRDVLTRAAGAGWAARSEFGRSASTHIAGAAWAVGCATGIASGLRQDEADAGRERLEARLGTVPAEPVAIDAGG